MDFIDLKNKTDKELQEILHEERHHLHELRLKVGEKQLKNVRAIRKTKNLVAKVLTLLNSRNK
ncbi:MAG: 50S ribosomal protein L29 [Candidatus Magasanikbacteria bacterium GW2011_GWC2_37_14]|uniref:Large ribosomal subunit protein uL29 n=1 Tax=Candidatus Magasanikbacteria bacterium GW2011_GWC2_37_14 TaxID=1619046 RepID=A0A0G0GAZ5_9BACT|nr:MAG: 50S ribosomal protein L29 [Candidatus Magasanikbacteria bacterium GW2011_GWC2_37_14]